MNRDYCIIRVSFPTRRGLFSPSAQVFNLRSDIYSVWQEAEDSCERSDVFLLKAVNSFALKDRKRLPPFSPFLFLFSFYFFFPEAITF